MSKHAALATINLPAGVYGGVQCVASQRTLIGQLTTERSESSYGMPVFVCADLNPAAYVGAVISPADGYTIELALDVDHLDESTTGADLLDAARRAGYLVKHG